LPANVPGLHRSMCKWDRIADNPVPTGAISLLRVPIGALAGPDRRRIRPRCPKIRARPAGPNSALAGQCCNQTRPGWLQMGSGGSRIAPRGSQIEKIGTRYPSGKSVPGGSARSPAAGAGDRSRPDQRVAAPAEAATSSAAEPVPPRRRPDKPAAPAGFFACLERVSEKPLSRMVTECVGDLYIAARGVELFVRSVVGDRLERGPMVCGA
jgi:hypothetical protein